MTLGEFRKYTEKMRDDVELFYHHAGGYHPINTFYAPSNNKLALCYGSYMQDDMHGITEAMLILFDKQKV